MINSKHLNKIVFTLLFLSLIACVFIVYYAQVNPNTKAVKYESKLFGDEILTIDIQVDEEDWQELLNNAAAKEYIPADLTINGETFDSVGLRAKGNSSLTQVAQMKGSDRYSLHFKFNKYQKGKTYYGLDSFCINNIISDNTYMKDYLSYHIMNYIGVPSPLMNYAKVTVNGEYFGFYIALERYEKAFLDRVYDTSGGQLYNVKIQMGNREDFMVGNDELRQPQDIRESESQDNRNENPPNRDKGAERFPQEAGGGFPGGMGGGPGGGQSGGSLIYTDDNISSYSSIFENSEFKKNTDKDKQRVIKALKNLDEGMNLEKYFDVDEILRYLAAHTVVVNLDSYSSSMAQNYYIYERDGRISILPWDYNLAFGGFQGGNASNTINFPIDTPVSGVSMGDRPLISKLLEVPEYKEKYHEYLTQIVKEYFKGGIFEETINALDEKINDYVKNDTSSFTTYEKYTASLPILKELVALRAESIEGQLNGTIPSTTEGQNANKDLLISGDGINLSDLGSFMNGGGDRGHPGNQMEQGGGGARGEPGVEERPGGKNGPGGQESPIGRGEQEGGNTWESPYGMPDMSKMRDAMIILQESGGVISDEIREKLLALGLDDDEIEHLKEMVKGFNRDGFENRDNRNFLGQDSPGRLGRAKDGENSTAMNSVNREYAIVISLLVIMVMATT